MNVPKLEILTANKLDSQTLGNIDCTLLIFNDSGSFSNLLAANKVLGPSMKLLDEFVQADPAAATGKDVNLIVTSAGKLIVSPTGQLLCDYDDVRRYAEATARAIKRAKSLKGVKNLLLVLQGPPLELMEPSIREEFSHYYEVAALAALAELYEPLEARESLSDLQENAIESVRIVLADKQLVEGDVNMAEKTMLVEAVEIGRRLAKDIGGADPERMTAIRAAETIEKFFSASNLNSLVKITVVEQMDTLKKEYPLLAAVARASEHVPRHAPRVVHLEYRSPDQSHVKEDLYMIGKGINYDTGGADLKVGGAMGGMSRDKCGAAALAGFMATCALLRPTHVNVSVSLAFVRNSIGSNSYVADEIIKSRTGIRVRIGNTDAEGRMVMSDLLAHHKERALASGRAERARLFTCATLTGHVVRAYGPYAAAMENGPAKLLSIGKRLKSAGQRIGDCFEVSTLRREDFDLIQPLSNCEDVLQANKLPSTMTNRGHQYPAAFLTIASGLVKHGLKAARNERLAYTHLDIAGVAEEPGFLAKTTGSPIAALTVGFLKN